MYQEWINLIGLVEEDTAKILNGISAKDGWREFQPKEALNMGFEELVNLSGNRCSFLMQKIYKKLSTQNILIRIPILL